MSLISTVLIYNVLISLASRLMEKTVPMLLDISELPVVAIDEMNTTHENEVALVNVLHQLIVGFTNDKVPHEKLSLAIEEFASHVEQHFSREEQLMEQYGFPAFRVHKSEHDRVRAELQTLLQAWRERGDIQPLASYLENVHPVWAKNHIATMDTMTALYISRTAGGSL